MGETSRWQEELRRLIAEHLGGIDDYRGLDLTTELASLGLDSLGSVGLLVDIEEHFGIEFPGEVLTAETFATASTVEKVVGEILAGRVGEA